MNAGSRRGVILLLVLLFSAPVLTAIVLRVAGWSPSETDNHGVLLAPPAALAVGDGNGLAGHWLLVFAPARPCESACVEDFDALARVHRTLGRNAHRVVLAHAGPVGEAAGKHASRDVSDAAWLDELAGAAPGGLRANAAYLVDPRGYLIMWYPPGFEASGLLDDLEKLLRYSRVGVQ